MPRIRIFERHIVQATPSVNVTYEPGENVLAPDDHIAAIVAAGRGERLSARGDAFAVSVDETTIDEAAGDQAAI